MGFGSEEYLSVHFACTNAVSKSLVRGVSEGAVMLGACRRTQTWYGDLIPPAAHAKGRERICFQGNNMWQWANPIKLDIAAHGYKKFIRSIFSHWNWKEVKHKLSCVLCYSGKRWQQIRVTEGNEQLPDCQNVGSLLVLIGLVGTETNLISRDLKANRWNPGSVEITVCFVTSWRDRIFPTLHIVDHYFPLMGLKHPSKGDL